MKPPTEEQVRDLLEEVEEVLARVRAEYADIVQVNSQKVGGDGFPRNTLGDGRRSKGAVSDQTGEAAMNKADLDVAGQAFQEMLTQLIELRGLARFIDGCRARAHPKAEGKTPDMCSNGACRTVKHKAGLCKACYFYGRRHGTTRPPELIARAVELKVYGT